MKLTSILFVGMLSISAQEAMPNLELTTIHNQKILHCEEGPILAKFHKIGGIIVAISIKKLGHEKPYAVKYMNGDVKVDYNEDGIVDDKYNVNEKPRGPCDDYTK